MKLELNKLLLVVNKEIKKAEKNHLQARVNASEVAASAAHSPSQAGDRYHSQGTADILKERIEALKKLKREVESGYPRFIKKGKDSFFLVRNVTLLPGVKLISMNSPVGKKLIKYVERG